MASLSNADQRNLSKEQQAQIAALKQQYAQAQQAGDKAAMDKAHADAEAIRASAGYSGGASGSGYTKVGANQGGQTAEQVRQWEEDYVANNYDPKRGWTNGYDVSMNARSRANYIRQQMQANSDAWHTASDAEKEYLHQQNVELAKLLGTEDTYDPKTGKWYTWNTNVGYGTDLNPTMPNVVNSWKKYLGYTDDEINKWANDTDRYYNFVDTRAIRKGVDESSGFTGQYRQFINGPYAGLLRGSDPSITNPSVYSDSYHDGWGWGENGVGGDIQYDENGDVILRQQPLKYNNAVSKYTNQFTAYPENGVLQQNILNTKGRVNADDYSGLRDLGTGYRPNTEDDSNNAAAQIAYAKAVRGSGGSGGYGTRGSSYADYLNQMYAAALESQMAGLESSYNQNLSDLDANVKKTGANYTEQKRQATGQSAQAAANWRELANAYGLNSGVIGQAGLAQNNQLQSNLNALGAAQAAAQEELERQRMLLGQQYQAAINEAKANFDFQRVQALYQEAVRAEETLIQQQQYNNSLALQYAQMAMQQNQWQQEFARKLAAGQG